MGRGRITGSRMGATAAKLKVTVQKTQQTAPQAQKSSAQSAAQTPATSGPPDASKGFSAMSSQDQNNMLQRQRQKMTGATRKAISNYIDPARESNGYAKSQNMNHALNTGAQLTSSQKAMQTGLDKIMVPIGKQAVLYRADHDAFLTRMGIDPQSFSTSAQLKAAVKGVQWTQKGYISTSHTRNLSPFMPGNYMGGGREVEIEYHCAPGLMAALVQRGQGEVLLGRNTHHRIIDAGFTGGIAYPQKGGRKRVAKFIIEVW